MTEPNKNAQYQKAHRERTKSRIATLEEALEEALAALAVYQAQEHPLANLIARTADTRLQLRTDQACVFVDPVTDQTRVVARYQDKTHSWNVE